jgi:phenylacetate-coenzyme A ligase PaaK-like adenylate-forming protein
MLSSLAEEAHAGRLRMSPATIWSNSEVLLPETRAMAEATWRAPVLNAGIASEGPGGIACHVAPGFHIAEDLNVIEPVDNRQPGAARNAFREDPCSPISPTESCLSSDMRLRTSSRLLTSDCGCGLAYQKVQDVQGRSEDIFVYGDGVRVHPHLFNSILGRDPAITMHQARQTAQGVEISAVTTAAINAKNLRCALEKSLSQVGLKNPRMIVQSVAEIP